MSTTPEMIAHHFIAARLSGAHITDPAALPQVDSLDHAYEIQKVSLLRVHAQHTNKRADSVAELSWCRSCVWRMRACFLLSDAERDGRLPCC